MPWCEDCAKYFAPTAMSPDGTCPACGRSLDEQRPITRVTGRSIDLRRLASGADGSSDDAAAPWHFRLLVGLLAVYLVWRVIDLFVG